jgi:hypothetical protein
VRNFVEVNLRLEMSIVLPLGSVRFWHLVRHLAVLTT